MVKSIVSRRPKTSSQSDQGDPTRSNVTLPLPVDEDWFPCPLCQGLLAVKSSKKGKPYVVCDLCGVQLFIRKPEGIRRFRLMLSSERVRGSMRLGRLLEFYDYLTRRLYEVRTIKNLQEGDPALDEEEKLLVSQRQKNREILINVLREKKRQLEAYTRKTRNEK